MEKILGEENARRIPRVSLAFTPEHVQLGFPRACVRLAFYCAFIYLHIYLARDDRYDSKSSVKNAYIEDETLKRWVVK